MTDALGLVLSIGTFAALIGQLPGGLLVDHIHRKRISCGRCLDRVMGGAALAAMRLAPTEFPLGVGGAEIAHGLASCVMTPTIAALTLCGLRHRTTSASGFGQNTRYASLGNARVGRAAGCSRRPTISEQAVVFLVTAALVVPAMLVALFMIRMTDRLYDPADDHRALLHPRERASTGRGRFSPNRRMACLRCRNPACCFSLPTLRCCHWR